ncbi:N-formylglutamate amidohydrolase [Szabonella alba]|uniref:N-formylglutamate amidohydrolase n=1 Tax=Szabonella alba TaxID=2804194 RepID=A0A8K0Y195_9RHOB|nr:N-formylglutamate amidohydrolase [Szabonella alba]MBL4915784.1 N-formylglutamate amidohydrolase [Szabonella alba]
MSDPSYRLSLPARRSTPVVFSSPHSGNDYSVEFRQRSRLDALALRSSEDAFVDRLFACAPLLGAPLLAARMPRAWIDLNRAPEELDPALIEEVPRQPHNPRIASGLGVIPRVVSAGRPIYHGKISKDEADDRLSRHWQPYHRALRGLLDESHRLFGQAILIDCHSMPHEAIEAQGRPGTPPPEVVLGDRFGAAADRAIVDRIAAAFSAEGLRVARNTPFAGAYIAQTYGRPSRRQHVVQIEIDRALYMQESSLTPRPDFDRFADLIARVVAGITETGRDALPLAAE